MKTTFKPLSGIHFTFSSYSAALSAAEELATSTYLRQYGSCTSNTSRFTSVLDDEVRATQRPVAIVTAFGLAGQEAYSVTVLIWASKFVDGKPTEFFFSVPYARML